MNTHVHVRHHFRAGLAGCAALALLASAAGLLAPAPAAAKEGEQGRKRWILDLTHGPLRTVVVSGAARGAAGQAEGTQAYHYLTLHVANRTGFARTWAPSVKAHTDTGRTYIAGGHAEALAEIRKREGNANLQPLNATAGTLANGTSVDTVAILGPLDSLYDRVTIEIYGLVDHIATYKMEQYGNKSPEGARGDAVVIGPRTVIVDSAYYERNQRILAELRREAAESGGLLPSPGVEYTEVAEERYWEAVYERLGDEFHAEDDMITFVRSGWKVKGEPKGLRVITVEGGGS